MVYDGMDFLRAFNEGKPLPLGSRIVVIGGGNVAYDVARSAVRPFESMGHSEALSDMERGEQVAYDVARSALRLSSDKEVHVVCLECREEMPADEVEVDGRRRRRPETAQFPRARARCWAERNGHRPAHHSLQSRLRCRRPLQSHLRRAGVEDIPADSVIFAIGQSSDLSFLEPEDGVETRARADQGESAKPTRPPRLMFTPAAISPTGRACLSTPSLPPRWPPAPCTIFCAARAPTWWCAASGRPPLYTMAEGWNVFRACNPPVLDATERAASLQIIEEPYPEARCAAAGRALPALQRQYRL